MMVFIRSNMAKKLISYTIPKMIPAKRTKMHRELFGFLDSSNHGKYKYRRKGIVEKTKSKRINDALIITNEKKLSKITKILEKYNAKIWVFDVLD